MTEVPADPVGYVVHSSLAMFDLFHSLFPFAVLSDGIPLSRSSQILQGHGYVPVTSEAQRACCSFTLCISTVDKSSLKGSLTFRLKPVNINVPKMQGGQSAVCYKSSFPINLHPNPRLLISSNDTSSILCEQGLKIYSSTWFPRQLCFHIRENISALVELIDSESSALLLTDATGIDPGIVVPVRKRNGTASLNLREPSQPLRVILVNCSCESAF